MTEQRRISFSPPDITQAELDEVADALKSGWITTGPKTKEFEREIARFTQADRAATFASATAALECALRALGIGPGDEVITSAYTYTASCSVICHVGATPVLCDVAPGSYEMDYDAWTGSSPSARAPSSPWISRAAWWTTTGCSQPSTPHAIAGRRQPSCSAPSTA
ncbi:aminotransferase class I/II-fold pyridoxal phosphate-dependent enzyme [Eggerthella sinensis]|uniref:aminotransferase class I/II-fold pyridoxal phosphate-dependent enzyme n=1 Tax=Eggerthella sinensis TaxID=242230 RepID=UPI0022E2B01E|nr:aminotransferase class I/II-fold pyridoxal phosphate-dependent enzyme [Eggerthella sinensis]